MGCEVGDLDNIGPIEPDELPITAELQRALEQWAETFDGTYEPDPQDATGFSSDAEERQFDKEGRRLWRALQQELPNVKISYFSILDGKVYH